MSYHFQGPDLLRRGFLGGVAAAAVAASASNFAIVQPAHAQTPLSPDAALKAMTAAAASPARARNRDIPASGRLVE